MIVRLLAYSALALAVLNLAENTGLVEKNRYLTFLPRWQEGSARMPQMFASHDNTLKFSPGSAVAHVEDTVKKQAKALPATVAETTDELGQFITEQNRGH